MITQCRFLKNGFVGTGSKPDWNFEADHGAEQVWNLPLMT